MKKGPIKKKKNQRTTTTTKRKKVACSTMLANRGSEAG
jgi:hypothetical protein